MCNMCNLQHVQFATCAICNTCNSQHVQFATRAIYNICNLHNVQFAICAICNMCSFQYMQLAIHAICNTCNLQHVQFATHSTCITYNLQHMQFAKPAIFNARNSYMGNNLIFDGIHSTDPTEYLKSNITRKLTFGCYGEEAVTTKLTEWRSQGTIFPYGQNPASLNCQGWTLRDNTMGPSK